MVIVITLLLAMQRGWHSYDRGVVQWAFAYHSPCN